MIREHKGGNFVVVRISDVECIGFGDNNPVTPVEHVLSGTVMPSLYNPILGYGYTLSLVGKRIIPQNQRFVWLKVFEPVQKRLEQLVVIFSLPNICHFIAAKVM